MVFGNVISNILENILKGFTKGGWVRLTAVLRTNSDKGGDGGEGLRDTGGSEGGHSGGLGTGHHRAGWYIAGL